MITFSPEVQQRLAELRKDKKCCKCGKPADRMTSRMSKIDWWFCGDCWFGPKPPVEVTRSRANVS